VDSVTSCESKNSLRGLLIWLVPSIKQEKIENFYLRVLMLKL